jgi:hypothetical protein
MREFAPVSGTDSPHADYKCETDIFQHCFSRCPMVRNAPAYRPGGFTEYPQKMQKGLTGAGGVWYYQRCVPKTAGDFLTGDSPPAEDAFQAYCGKVVFSRLGVRIFFLWRAQTQR